MATAVLDQSCLIPRTQKARGIDALHRSQFRMPSFNIYNVQRFSETAGQFFIPKDTLLGRFVRPCPMRPRHGFVDSRPVLTLEDAEKLLAETTAAEPEAEVVAMPFINAPFSAVWTKGLLTVGKGHDGATAGNTSRTIPILGVPEPKFPTHPWETVLKTADITEAPYVELLWEQPKYPEDEHLPLYVQLRNGPELPTSTDFIPRRVTVTEVVVAAGDLLEWEVRAKQFTEGTVVYHPGGSLASHYAVHAVLNNIPVLISRQPVVGETLEQASESLDFDLEKIRAGFMYGVTCPTLLRQSAARAMLVALHSTAVWKGKRDELLGFGMGCAYRLTVIAALGEMRHHRDRRRRASRNYVYSSLWNKVLNPGTRVRYIKALESFQNDYWPSSFGGVKWYEFTRWGGAMYNALIERDIQKALQSLNHLVHSAHNNGWGFNKFIESREMDITASNPFATAVKVGPELYEAILAVENNPELAKYFQKRKRYELDLPDMEEAAKQIAEEEANGKPKVCSNCGDPCCDGDPYDGDGCTYQENPCENGCGNSKCKECGHSGNVVYAQATLVSFKNTNYLAVQYKHEYQGKNKAYHTKNVWLKPSQLTPAVQQMFSKPHRPSLHPYISKSYVQLIPDVRPNSFWLGSINVKFD